MKRLQEALKSMEITLAEAKHNQPTQPLGLISEDGKSNITLCQETQKQHLKVMGTGKETQPIESQQQKEKPFQNSVSQEEMQKRWKIQLTELVSQCFNSLNTYGKSPEQLPDIIKMFVLVLQEYNIQTIQRAFAQYLRQSSAMPTPADIVNIIEPPQEELSAAVYVTIRKKIIDGNVYVTNAEKEYVHAFENQELKKVRGGSLELRDAQGEVERYRNRLEYYN